MTRLAEYAIDTGWDPALPDHLSPTQLGMFQRCKFQFWRRYLHHEKERPGESLTVGSAVHGGLDRNYRQKITSHVDLPTHELLEWFTDEGWQKTLAEQQESSGLDILWNGEPEEAMKRGRSMLGAYHKLVAPRVQPVGVEGWISVDFGAPVPVEGRYDVELENGVIDVKTGKRAERKPKGGWRIQAAVYGEATGKPVEFHSVTATEKSRTPTIITPLEAPAMLCAPSENERAAQRAIVLALCGEIYACFKRYGLDEPWPTTGVFHDWACNTCGWRPICPAWDS